MMMGKQLRLRRFNPSGRIVMVALDRGGRAGIAPGLERPADIVKMASQAGASGIVVTPGILTQVSDSVGSLAVLLRIDGCVSIEREGPLRLFTSVEHASCCGVDGVIVTAVVGSPHESEELQKLGKVASAGQRFGVPVFAEMLSWKMLLGDADADTGPLHDWNDEVALACRIGVEMGADAVKTRYSGDTEGFRQIVQATGCPVLVSGEPYMRAELSETLTLVDQALEAGASGVGFGPRIWQHHDPPGALRAVCAMVHEDATVTEALDLMQLS